MSGLGREIDQDHFFMQSHRALGLQAKDVPGRHWHPLLEG
jgi:hypothetical protein